MKRHLLLVYWLLLLVSTLAIGAVAFSQLDFQREKVLALAADSARAKGQTIADNLDLLVLEAKAGLMNELTSIPDAGAEVEMIELKQLNQRVRRVFLYRPGLGLVIPSPGTRDYSELESNLRARDGWVWGVEAQEADRTSLPHLPGANGANYGSLKAERTDARFPQSRAPQNGSVAAGALVTSSSLTVASNGNVLFEQQSVILQIPVPAQPQAVVPATANDAGGLGEPIDAPAASGLGPLLQDPASSAPAVNSSQRFNVTTPTDAAAAIAPSALAAPPAKNWLPVNTADGVRWLGWARVTPGGAVRGVELDWPALRRAMRTAFPARLEAGEGFVLRNPDGEAVEQRFADGRLNTSRTEGPNATKPLAVIPVGEEMPGWTLAVYLNPAANFSSSFALVSAVMVGILVVTVMLGGTLLLRQARRDATDAARKTTFVSSVSHELKTPLTTIRMYAELLEEGRVRDETRRRDYLATIVGETQRLTRLVNNVLDFGRLEQGRKQYNTEDVPLGPLVAGVLAAQQPRLDEAGLSVEANLPEGEAVCARADRDAIEQVLLNLLDNAMKYAAEGKWLGVTVRAEKDRAVLEVADFGPGVPEDQRDQIFDMFHRVNDSITSNQPGCGLGLSIARRLLRDQDGDLRFAPNTPRGSRFIVSLPLAAPARVNGAVREGVAELAGAGRNGH